MACPTSTVVNQVGSHNRRSSSREEVVSFLESSPKGRLVYQTGWDKSPNSIWQFVKTVQSKSEEKKNDVLERAYRAAEVAGRRSLSSLEANSISNSNSYRNKSLNENQLLQTGALTPSPNSNTSYGLYSSSTPSLSNTPNHSAKQLIVATKSSESNLTPVSSSKFVNRPKRLSNKFLGIREEDNDFDGVEDDDLGPSSCAFYEVKSLMLKHQNAMLAESIKRTHEMLLSEMNISWKKKELEVTHKITEDRKQREMILNQQLKQQEENMKLSRSQAVSKRQMFQEKDDHQFEDHRREELLKLSEAQKQVEQDLQKKFEEQQRNELLAKEKEAAESREKERLKKLEAQAAAEAAKLEEEKRTKPTLQSLPKGHDVPPELANVILREDLQRYTKLITMEEEYGNAVAHISSSNPAVKDYYFAALKVVNTPLNSLANLSEGHLQQKVMHFLDLLSGKPVLANDTMKVPFQATSVQSGNLFIMKLLAYRFIKKSETEITKQKSCIDSLALVGVHLCKRFPEWATLVHANFYKMCPFLVPFSFPRNDDTLEQYAQRMGHDLSGGESAMLQTLLDRITGYCTLYALMVKQFENHKIDDIGHSASFYSISEVWRILSTLMRLEPQLDVTATVFHVLLDVLGGRLQAVYGKQFLKLIHHLVNLYLPKMRNVTPPGKAGALTRLQIFIKQKWF